MEFLRQIERYCKLDELIKQEKTGTPSECADKLSISRSHLYRIIDLFKEFGAEISYTRKNGKY